MLDVELIRFEGLLHYTNNVFIFVLEEFQYLFVLGGTFVLLEEIVEVRFHVHCQILDGLSELSKRCTRKRLLL